MPHSALFPTTQCAAGPPGCVRRRRGVHPCAILSPPNAAACSGCAGSLAQCRVCPARGCAYKVQRVRVIYACTRVQASQGARGAGARVAACDPSRHAFPCVSPRVCFCPHFATLFPASLHSPLAAAARISIPVRCPSLRSQPDGARAPLGGRGAGRRPAALRPAACGQRALCTPRCLPLGEAPTGCSRLAEAPLAKAVGQRMERVE